MPRKDNDGPAKFPYTRGFIGFSGRLLEDPREVKSDTVGALIRIAAQSRTQSTMDIADELRAEYDTQSMFISCFVHGSYAEYALDKLGKGDTVFIIGSNLEDNSWLNDKDEVVSGFMLSFGTAVFKDERWYNYKSDGDSRGGRSRSRRGGDDEDEAPRSRARRSRDEDEGDERPARARSTRRSRDEADEEEAPRARGGRTRASRGSEDEESAPRARKRRSRDEDDE